MRRLGRGSIEGLALTTVFFCKQENNSGQPSLQMEGIVVAS